LLPQIKTDLLYRLLREGNVAEFNRRRAAGESSDLTNCDFRATDLRGLHAEGLDFSGCYFRRADLRGIDFTKSRLEGASLNGARVSGCFFPVELRPDEIELSISHGTRMRYRP